MKKVLLVQLFLLLWSIHAEIITFAAIADPQWKNEDLSKYEGGAVKTGRCYGLSQEKLRNCISNLNSMDNLDFVITLGDVVDVLKDYTGENNLLSMMEIYKELKHESYFVAGNHDEGEIEGKTALEYLGIDLLSGSKDEGYYSFSRSTFRFIALDTQDGRAWKVSDKQLIWLNSELNDAKNRGQSVIIFAHINVYPIGEHGLANSKDVLDIIDGYDNVIAYINGHEHSGLYGLRDNGTHYLTLKGMVQRSPVEDNTTYSIITIDTDRKKIIKQGYGWESSMTYDMSVEEYQSPISLFSEVLFY